MPVSQIVNESQLDNWVRGNAAKAQGTIVELVWRLVCASCPKPANRRFPLGDSIGQHGPDGELETEIGFLPYVHEGKSIWEIGTNIDAKKKANEDFNGYKDPEKSHPALVKQETTFVFVTPLSGRRAWKYTRKADGIQTWVDEKKKSGEWKDVVVLDGTRLVEWVSLFPAVGHWLGKTIGHMPENFDTAESIWKIISSYGAPPPLSPDLFTIGRNQALEKLRSLVIEQNGSQLRFDTRYPRHPKDFVSAFIASLPDEERFEYQNRVLILYSEHDFKKVCSLNILHVLIADFDLDNELGTQLIQRAMQMRHVVIYSSQPGGIPHGNPCALYNPHDHEMKNALIKSGYTEERARTLTNYSGRDLSALLRLIQGLSAMPEWATQSSANDMAIAQLIGQWQEESEGDQAIIEELSGKTYGEWIVNIRKAASVKSAPLEFFNGRWKFTSRYEPWLYLGRLIGIESLTRFEKLAVEVLSEIDPGLDLPKEQRFVSSIYGQKQRYSDVLRKGFAETLALLGSHGEALKSCPEGSAKQIAWRVTNSLLTKADSKRWSSLNHILPLLAEAAADEFLNAVGGASEKSEEPFSGVFAEEGDPLYGGNYISGLLWALESLAWNDNYLIRICCILANLAAIDPGGQWANRPANSLRDILLPWLPQTVADAQKRHAAVKSIIREHPDVAWELLLQLLPECHSSSRPTHRPKWQNFIPEEWENGVTNKERWKDEAFYADLALELAGTDPERLGELLRFYFLLHPNFCSFAVDYRARIQSQAVLSLPEEQRLKLWTALTTKITNHRKYADSEVWDVPEEYLLELELVADRLKPTAPEIYHKQLFAGPVWNLFEEKGNWEEQGKVILKRRINALHKILARGGFDLLQSFWRSVDATYEVGNTFGADEELANDDLVLPAMLETGVEADSIFAKSYVGRRFHFYGWNWVETIDRKNWSVSAKAQFFTALPFTNETWKRVTRELGNTNDVEYWKHVRGVPENDHLEQINYAISRLIDFDRSDAAIQCFWLGSLWGGEFSELGLRALEAFNDNNHIDTHAIEEVFNHLQQDETFDRERLAAMEIKFLELLNRFSGARPRTLYRHLAERPEFFCQVIRMIYRSKNEVNKDTEKIEVDEKTAKIAERAYELLRDWDYTPGNLADGRFDGQLLNEWVSEVKRICIDSGHWEVASHRIGEVLFYAPKDVDGLWVDPVCELLDSKSDEGYRIGLRIKIYNSRGAHWFSEGKEEIELAEKWEAIADHAENKGLIRLGAILRELGKEYRELAKRTVLEHLHGYD